MDLKHLLGFAVLNQNMDNEDIFGWSKKASGEFSLKSAYHAIVVDSD